MSIDSFLAKKFPGGSGPFGNEPIVYRLLTPESIEPGQKYPVVLFLHGAGERGDDNQPQLKFLPLWMATKENRKTYPCFLIAPQCPCDRLWSQAEWGARLSTELPEQPTRELKAVGGVLDEVLSEHPIDLDRVYLTGLSMGGYGVWEMALRTPDRFAAAAPICGGGDESKAARLKDLPIWAWHGELDDAVPVERSRRMIAAIRQSGGSPRYTELAGVGHDSWTNAYTDPDGLVPWLFQQRRRC